MTRRLHSCLTCGGKTRHRAVCGPCRRRGVTVVGQEITVPVTLAEPGRTRLLLADPADIHAPTVAELERATDLTRYLAMGVPR